MRKLSASAKIIFLNGFGVWWWASGVEGSAEQEKIWGGVDETGKYQDDYELMRRIAGGDAAALSALYDRYSGLVLALGRRMLGDHGEAEDFLIDVFWETWQRGARYDAARGAPVTYLMTLARSRAIDRQRASSNRIKTRNNTFDPGDGVKSGLPSNDPAADAQRDERCVRVQRAIAQLDAGQREAVEMSFFEGLSHSEIAAKLNKPLGTVKTNIRQGLIRLREFLRSDQ